MRGLTGMYTVSLVIKHTCYRIYGVETVSYINNTRYADDTLMMADCAGNLKNLNLVNRVSEKYGLKLNTQKIQVMAVNRNNN